MKTVKQFTVLIAAFAIMASGCNTMTRTQKGAAVGAAGGGAIGAVAGRALGNTAMGAIIGAAVGGTAGAVIGRRMDKQAEEMQKVLGDAEVKRQGEGIVVEFKEQILFGFDQAVLGSPAKQNLDKLVEVLNRYPDTNIEIIGHTDDKGAIGYNQRLSERRAAAVASYLRNNAITSSRVTAKGMGESDPRVPNTSDANRAVNRRVEFVITANQKMIQDRKSVV